MVVDRPGAHGQAPRRGRHLLQGIECIAHQVEQDLLDLHQVHVYPNPPRLQVELDREAPFAGIELHEGTDLSDQMVEVDLGADRRLLAHQRPQAADNLTGPLGLQRDLAHGVHELLALTRIALETAAATIGEIDDGRERLVDLVGHPRGYLAHGAQTADMDQLRLVPARFLLGAAYCRDVTGIDIRITQLGNRDKQQ